MDDDISLDAAEEEDEDEDDEDAAGLVVLAEDVWLLLDAMAELLVAPVWAWVRAGIAAAPAASTRAAAIGRKGRMGNTSLDVFNARSPPAPAL